MSDSPPEPWQVVLALRWRVWRRRHVSPLEAVVLLAVCGLAFLVGRAAGERLDPTLAAAAVTAGLLLVVATGVAAGRQLLFRSRELTLLLTHGLTPRTLVRVRALELTGVLAAALAPLLAAVAGHAKARGGGPSPLLALALLALPVACAGLGLVGGWLIARRPRLAQAALLAALAATASSAVWPPALRAVGHALAPGGALLELAAGRPPLGLVLVLALGGLALLLADRAIPPTFAVTLDRAVPRRRQGALLPWRLLGVLARPLGRQAGALLQRDLALLGRGGFARGLVILALLPLALGIVHLVQQDRQLRGWHLQLVGLLVSGVVASAAGFLFGVDFPRARRGCLVLERTSPLRARAVLLSRWIPAALYAGAIALGAAALMAAATRSELARQALPFLPKGLLIAAIVSHHAVTYGLRSEAALDPAEAAAYPLNGAVVVILFALALLVHPLGALGYLLWAGFIGQALRRWEVAEVETPHGAAA